MKVEMITKASFSVIGKLGQGPSNEGFKWVPPLWQEANSNFNEISTLAKLDADGNILGIWGAMSDVDEKFERWKEEGKYLAGCEVIDNAAPPANWVKWVIPSYKYAVIQCTEETYGTSFSYMLNEYLPQNHYNVEGAVHEFYDPKCTNGELFLYFPIEKL